MSKVFIDKFKERINEQTSQQIIKKLIFIDDNNYYNMQETIKLLDVIDSRIRHQSSSIPSKQNSSYIRRSKFPYARVLDFTESKFNKYPSWLTERNDFLQFMYQKYEKKLLSIPKICEKQKRASDEKYFVNLYLEQIPIFKGLPRFVLELILDQITTHYYKSHEVIHHQDDSLEFMAVIFLGSVQYEIQNHKVTKIKNDVIFTQAFYDKKHPKVIAKEETVLLTINKKLYTELQKRIVDDLEEKSRDQIADLMKSDFFIELHLKDRKAKTFFEKLKPEFYFPGEHICEAGEMPNKFFIHFKGQIIEKNHIYIREHNKWPLPNRKWEVRAVYNSFKNTGNLKQFSFFGDEEIINSLRTKSTYIAKTHSILFSMNKNMFLDSLTTEDFKRLKKYRNEHININYTDFEKNVRGKVKSLHEKKKIVHKAIDTSFAHRKDFFSKKVSLVNQFEKNMLSRSVSQSLRDIEIN